MEIKRFIDFYEDENIETKFDSGRLWKIGEDFFIKDAMVGAEETFSIGQPVFDEDGDVLGYLGISLLRNLNYYTDGFDGRIPCEVWKVELPTTHCKHGIKVYTYWQNKERRNKLLKSIEDKKNESNISD